jgi:hypothetical protein
MTWKYVNFVLHWGVPLPGPTRRPVGTYTVHLAPGVPGWAPAKAAGLLREWNRSALGRTRRARWVTLGVRGRPRRWATAGVVRGGQLNFTTRSVRRFARGYDLTGWRHPVRGVTVAGLPWGVALHGETELVRPRYV